MSMPSETIDNELRLLVAKAQAAFEALPEHEKAILRYEQRRSFMRGSCPSHRDYTEWCEHVDKLLPPCDGERVPVVEALREIVTLSSPGERMSVSQCLADIDKINAIAKRALSPREV